MLLAWPILQSGFLLSTLYFKVVETKMRKLDGPQLPAAGDHNLLQLGISLWIMAVSRYDTSVGAIAVLYQVRIPPR